MHTTVLKRPLITEKTLFIANRTNAYTFEVDPSATKNQIAAAVKEIFNVKVTGVSTVMRNRSMRRTGKKRTMTLVPRKKKAMVTLAKGQTITLFDITGEEKKE